MIKISSKSLDYKIREMCPDDISTVLEIWKENRLFEGTHTIHTFLEIDPLGFYVAEEEDGKAKMI